jgi:hypothetical protein
MCNSGGVAAIVVYVNAGSHADRLQIKSFFEDM